MKGSRLKESILKDSRLKRQRSELLLSIESKNKNLEENNFQGVIEKKKGPAIHILESSNHESNSIDPIRKYFYDKFKKQKFSLEKNNFNLLKSSGKIRRLFNFENELKMDKMKIFVEYFPECNSIEVIKLMNLKKQISLNKKFNFNFRNSTASFSNGSRKRNRSLSSIHTKKSKAFCKIVPAFPMPNQIINKN